MTNSMPTGAPLNWRITQQVETTGIGPSGTYVKGVNVGFTTDGGHGGTVFLPLTHFTPEGVAAAVAAAVRLMRDVGGLTGTV